MSNNKFHHTASRITVNDTYLRRPHIHKLLEQSLEKPVTTIVAGAGYGKTQAVYAFLQEYDTVTIWLQLSMFDNLPIRLWENFVYAVSLQNDELAANLIGLGFPESMASYYRFLTLFSEEIKKGRKYTIVYDDLYLIHEKSVLNFFEKIISSYIPNLSLIFISRKEPEMNTIGLLSKGLLSTITEDDFRFSEIEMSQYFQMQNIQISPKTESDLYKYTDGWIFAIYLVALSLKKGMVKESHAISAVKGNINRLIDLELFSVITKEMQDLLITLSLLDDVPLDLLEEVFPNSDHIIMELSKIGSFVRYDAFMNTYRIHHLFLDFLRERQSILETAKVQNIHCKAAAWYDKNGFAIDAITLYAKIHDYNKFFDVTMTLPVHLPKEIAAFIIELLDRVSESAMKEKPILKILYSRLLLCLKKYKEANDLLLDLKDKYESLPASEENNVFLCELYIALGIIETGKCCYTGTMGRTAEFYQKALEFCPNGSLISKNMSMNFSPYISKAGIDCDFESIIQEQKDIAKYYKFLLNGICYGSVELAQAEYAYFRKDFKNAEKYALQSIHKTLKAGQFHIENMTHFYLLRIYVSMGSYPKTLDRLNLLRARVEKQNHQDSYTLFDIASGWVYSVIGQTDKVAPWLRDDSENALGISSSSIFGIDVLTRARCYLAEERYSEILALLEGQKDSYLKIYLLGQIETTVLKAVAFYYTHEHNEAFAALQTAYELALPNSLVMPFIEHGSSMRTIANAAILDKNCVIPKQWLEDIRTRSSTYSKRLNQIKKEYQMSHRQEHNIQLTKRETVILADICRGLTREEIALEQNLSINTIKSVVASIFLKLGAVNVADAVRIAVEKKLLK